MSRVSATIVAGIVRDVSTKLDIPITDTLITNITYYCKRLDANKLQKIYQSNDQLQSHITQQYLDHISATTDTQSSIQSSNQSSIPSSIQSSIQSSNDDGEKVMHVMIDSVNRNVTHYDDIVDFQFHLTDRHTINCINTGRIPAIQPLADTSLSADSCKIHCLKLDHVILPYPVEYDQLNPTREITLTFTGIRNNGTIISTAMRNETIHFSFHYTRCAFNQNLIYLRPVNKFCRFDPPLAYTDNFSLRWNDPIYAISFMPDRAIPKAFRYDTTDGQIEFSSKHNLAAGDVIIVQKLQTLNDAANYNILTRLNALRGIPVTIIDPYVISTGIDFTSIISPDVNHRPLVLFANKCFRFPLEISYCDDIASNQINKNVSKRQQW